MDRQYTLCVLVPADRYHHTNGRPQPTRPQQLQQVVGVTPHHYQQQQRYYCDPPRTYQQQLQLADSHRPNFQHYLYQQFENRQQLQEQELQRKRELKELEERLKKQQQQQQQQLQLQVPKQTQNGPIQHNQHHEKLMQLQLAQKHHQDREEQIYENVVSHEYRMRMCYQNDYENEEQIQRFYWEQCYRRSEDDSDATAYYYCEYVSEEFF